MAKKSFEQCIESILADIQLRKQVNYGNRKSVNQYNRAHDRIVVTTKYIDENHKNQIDGFLSLIYHEDPVVSHTICCLILYNRVSCTVAQKREALRVVKALYSKGEISDVPPIAIPIIIQEWEQSLKMQDSN